MDAMVIQRQRNNISEASERPERDVFRNDRYGKNEINFMKENIDDKSVKRKSISLLYTKARSNSRLSLNSSVEKLYEKDFMFKKLDLTQKSKASFLRGK